MNKRQNRVVQSLRRVQDWSAANPGHVPAPQGQPDTWTPLTRQLDGLNSAVALVSDAGAEQGLMAKQASLEATDGPALRRALREALRHVTQVAQVLKGQVPGIGTLRMPSDKVQAEGLLRDARTLAKQAATYETVLVEHGLAPDFIAQLGVAIAALERSVDKRGSAIAGQVGATKQLESNLTLGKQYVRLMDAALSRTLKTDPAKLAEWKNARRVKMLSASNGGSAVASVQPAVVGNTVAPVSVPVVGTAQDAKAV